MTTGGAAYRVIAKAVAHVRMPPDAPTDLGAALAGNIVTLTWRRALTDCAPVVSAGLNPADARTAHYVEGLFG
jgi:hypothetical protein